jgi:hypothetical protein
MTYILAYLVVDLICLLVLLRMCRNAKLGGGGL